MRPLPRSGEAAPEDILAWCQEAERESHVPAAQALIHEAVEAGLVHILPCAGDPRRVRVVPAAAVEPGPVFPNQGSNLKLEPVQLG